MLQELNQLIKDDDDKFFEEILNSSHEDQDDENVNKVDTVKLFKHSISEAIDEELEDHTYVDKDLVDEVNKINRTLLGDNEESSDDDSDPLSFSDNEVDDGPAQKIYTEHKGPSLADLKEAEFLKAMGLFTQEDARRLRYYKYIL